MQIQWFTANCHYMLIDSKYTEQISFLFFRQKSNKPGRRKVKQLPAEIKMDNEENEAF